MPPKPKTADPPPPPDEEEAAPPPVMEKDVNIVVQVIVRKCAPLPEEAPRHKKTAAGSGEEEGEEGEGEEEGEGREAATGPKPTLEELGVKFVLNTFNGSTSERSPAACPIYPLCLFVRLCTFPWQLPSDWGLLTLCTGQFACAAIPLRLSGPKRPKGRHSRRRNRSRRRKTPMRPWIR